jgi:hypothetical protein
MTDQPKPAGFKGKRNLYACNTCRQYIVTIDVDEGVTPAFLSCKAMKGCPGTMGSAWYRMPAWAHEGVDFEWYRPTGKAYAKLSKAMRKHVDDGGLDLRKAKNRSRRRGHGIHRPRDTDRECGTARREVEAALSSAPSALAAIREAMEHLDTMIVDEAANPPTLDAMSRVLASLRKHFGSPPPEDR